MIIISQFKDVQFYLRLYRITKEKKNLREAISIATELLDHLGIVDKIVLMAEFPDTVRKELYAVLTDRVKPDLSSVESVRESYLNRLYVDLPDDGWEWLYGRLKDGIQEQAAI